MLKGCESRIPGNKGNEWHGAFLSLTFDLQEQADAANQVSILHSHGVVAAVLLFGTNQSKNAHVAEQRNKKLFTIVLMTGLTDVWER